METVNVPSGEWFYTGPVDIAVFKQRHHRDQLWFSFMPAILFQQEEKQKPQPTPKNAAAYLEAAVKRRIILDTQYIHHYVPKIGEDQYILPFAEWQIPSKKMGDAIRQAGWPGFDRDENGKLYQLVWAGTKTRSTIRSEPRAKEWVKLNCAGRVILEQMACFEKYDDMIFALTSGLFAKPKKI